VKPAVFDPTNQDRLAQLLKTAKTPFDKNDPATIELSVHDALWYWVFATNDASDKLGGQPYDNVGKRYRGSQNDSALNAEVVRVAADQAAGRSKRINRRPAISRSRSSRCTRRRINRSPTCTSRCTGRR
jgi:hypothetical protein